MTRQQITAALDVLGLGELAFDKVGPALVSVQISGDGMVVRTSTITQDEYTVTKHIIRLPRTEGI